MTKKVELGQFFTKKDLWIKSNIQLFIDSLNFVQIVDPFAGGGDLLSPFADNYAVKGYDIDHSFNWPINDSLKSIPPHHTDLCITNPPYLAKVSAARNKLNNVKEYFELFPSCEDLYVIGLNQCLNSFDYGVAIIPETYQISSNKSKRIRSINILEENPFEDTEHPVIVITWGPELSDDYDIYKNDQLIGSFKSLNKFALTSLNLGKNLIKFNNHDGNFGVICFDSTNADRICFTTPDKITSPVKVSSRSSSKILINTPVDINMLIDDCNILLEYYRTNTHDVFLAPFKGNTKSGVRRRRLDFETARYIIEHALCKQNPGLLEEVLKAEQDKKDKALKKEQDKKDKALKKTRHSS
jgi:hypothetical protein